MRASTLGAAIDPDDPTFEVDLVPTKVQDVSPAEAGVHVQDDDRLKIPRSIPCLLQQLRILNLRVEEANAFVVFMEELDVLDGVHFGETLMDAPAEERLRHRDILVDG